MIVTLAAAAVLATAACTPKTTDALDGEVTDAAPSPAVQAPDVSRVGIGEVYGEDIETVQFRIAGLELSNPIVDLGGAARLLLTFDVLAEDVREFRYDITHCDADWEPSQLSPIDYLASFTEGDITEYDLAFNTVTKYTRYELLLPNQYIAWTKSGNYLLNVYNDDTGELVIRQRFCVVEPLIQVRVNQVRPAIVSKDKSHQEFDAGISLRDIRLENPRRTTRLTAMQNGDWRTAVYNLEPRFIRDENLLWDYQNKMVWPAHREWRTLDLRSILAETGQIATLTREADVFSAFLVGEPSRAQFPPETRIDLNGKYVIEDFDNPLELQAEYANAIFTLKMPRDEALEPLYLYGALTDYKLDNSTLGRWNTITNGYTFRTRLKQGFYNYAFVSTTGQGLQPDWTETEGNWFQTENEYQFLLYYRPYGERYDRLIGYESVQVNR